MLGEALSVLAALLFGASMAVQKYRIKRIRRFSIPVLFRDRIWVSSIAITLAGMAVYILALGYASLTVVQPMMSVSILIPVLCGWLFFGERIGTKWLHIIFILAGVVLLSL